MKATTVKVEGDLLAELSRRKPADLSLSGYVRAILQQEILRRRMADAADEYAEFLRSTPAEREWIDQWDRADLAAPVKRRR